MTTAPILEGWRIESYLAVVSAQVVAGPGAVGELLASASGILGPRAGTCQPQMAAVYDDAVKQLTARAKALGANWVLGAKVDTDQISAKSVQAVMVTAIGTAVRATEINQGSRDQGPGAVLPAAAVTNTARKNALMEQLARGTLELDDATWTFAIEHGVVELADKFLADPGPGSPYDLADPARIAAHREAFFQSLRPDQAAAVLYRALRSDANGTAVELMVKLHLTDLARTRDALHDADSEIRRRALQTLRGTPLYYTECDVPVIEELLALIPQSFPEVSQRTQRRSLTGRLKEFWKCACGHDNPVGNDRCGRCERDVHGFLPSDLTPSDAVALLKAQRVALTQLLAAL